MNFISHYYIFHPNENPAFISGLILPDITRKAHKKFRLTQEYNDISKQFDHLQKGIYMHFETDKIFHDAPFFKTHTSALKAIANKNAVFEKDKYTYFFAHLVFEMMIDKILLDRDAEIGIHFYNMLLQADQLLIQNYISAIDKQQYLNDFKSYYQRFLESQYLNKYTAEGGLAYALKRVFANATLLNSMLNEKNLNQFLIAAEAYLEPFVDGIFEEVNTKLQSHNASN